MFHVACREFELERPKSVIICQHGIDRRFCEAKVKPSYDLIFSSYSLVREIGRVRNR